MVVFYLADCTLRENQMKEGAGTCYPNKR